MATLVYLQTMILALGPRFVLVFGPSTESITAPGPNVGGKFAILIKGDPRKNPCTGTHITGAVVLSLVIRSMNDMSKVVTDRMLA